MASAASRWILFAVLIAAALALRTHQLARRPMHSDEANQAVKFGELLEHGRYAIDARDHHGPTLYYAALPIAWARGQHTLAAIDEITVRLVPALAGTLAVALLVFIAGPLGRWPALAAGAFLAVSPPAVYYSRYFIQETLLSAFGLLALAGAIRWWQTGRVRWALAAAVGVGLLFATKATAPFFVVAALTAAWLARPPRPASPRIGRDGLLAAAAALLVAVALFSSFFTHPAGLWDAVAAYGFGAGRAASGSGHEKPWWYYLALFGFEKRGGLVWHQLSFTALALGGTALTLVTRFRRRGPALRGHNECNTLYDKPSPTAAAEPGVRSLAPGANTGDRVAGQPLLVGALAYTTIIALVLSATPYKTPWHAIHFVPGLAVLAAGALALLPRARMGLLFAALVLFMQFTQTRQAVFARAADERNPYAYVHSSSDVLKVRSLVAAALAAHPGLPVRVIGDEYWPIPWYVRGLDHIGYWNAAPADCDGALVLAVGSQIDVVRGRLRGRYHESYLGLRPDVLCAVFTPQP
jgi:uncharacterized protein (TIGR03663 family)